MQIFGAVQFQLMLHSSAKHGMPGCRQRPTSCRFELLLAAPAHRGCEPGHGSTRTDRAATAARWDGKTPVLAPLEQVCTDDRPQQTGLLPHVSF